MNTAVFLNQKRANVCEHTTKMASDAIFVVSSHIFQNISIRFLCVYVCLSYGDLFNFR